MLPMREGGADRGPPPRLYRSTQGYLAMPRLSQAGPYRRCPSRLRDALGPHTEPAPASEPPMNRIKMTQLSVFLGVSTGAVKLMEARGDLPLAFRIGKRKDRVWDWAELEPWLIEHGYYHPPVSPPMYHRETAAGPGARSKASSRGRQTSQTSTAGARRRSSKDGSGSAPPSRGI